MRQRSATKCGRMSGGGNGGEGGRPEIRNTGVVSVEPGDEVDGAYCATRSSPRQSPKIGRRRRLSIVRRFGLTWKYVVDAAVHADRVREFSADRNDRESEDAEAAAALRTAAGDGRRARTEGVVTDDVSSATVDRCRRTVNVRGVFRGICLCGHFEPANNERPTIARLCVRALLVFLSYVAKRSE